MMKFDSIKTRLLMIVTICLLGMLILVVNQIYSTKRLVTLHSQSNQLLQIENTLLQMRRHEKDFLLRHESSYVEKFVASATAFESQIHDIKPLFAKLGNIDDMLDELQRNFQHYQQGFHDLVLLQKQIGLDENSGFQGDFRQASHTLEEQFVQNQQTHALILLLQIRRNEKDFLQRKQMSYATRELDLYQQLSVNIAQTTQVNILAQQALLNDYQHGFMQLVEGHRSMGLDHRSGLQGQFREQAHSLEEQLNLVEERASLLVSHAHVEVKRNGLAIMAVTTLCLIVILVKSYLTFQRAFLNFVMFFYRCKREYQHMDSKKLGFAEFRHLASIANEMIDARRDIEMQLQAANRHIADLEGRPTQSLT
jgi:hypothetical protein